MCTKRYVQKDMYKKMCTKRYVKLMCTYDAKETCMHLEDNVISQTSTHAIYIEL